MLTRLTPEAPSATSSPISSETARQHTVAMLLPIMAVVSIAFLIVGFALPVLPLHVHLGLGLSTFVVGLVTGSQFAASLISRVWSGRYADQRGPKRAVIVGLGMATLSGFIYLLSLAFTGSPWVSVSVLLAGRALLGEAESFIITGAASWGLALAGAQNAGRVIAWMGMAMFASLALGAPLGTALYASGGFAAVAAATAVIPLVTFGLVVPLPPAAAQRGAPASFRVVARAVWMPGLGAALSSVGFGAMIAFSSLLAIEHAWSPVWLSFSAFTLALVLARPHRDSGSG
jgi:MFS family permease